MITAKQLVDSFRRYIDEKRGYVFGAQGELYSPELAEEWKNKGRGVPKGRKKATYFTSDCAKWFGHVVDDCSGGIIDSVRQYDPKFGDRTANRLFAQCIRSGGIDTLPEIPGLCLWKKGHIGVYEGDGNALEFRGTAYGCVRTRVSARPWTHWGMLACVDYSNVEKPDAVWTCSRVLKYVLPRMDGEDVLALQGALLEHGHPPGKLDGLFGLKTYTAVKSYQAAVGLEVDGKAGKLTITALGGRWEA